MLMMDRKRLLTKTCNLLEVVFVTLNVSDPYKRTVNKTQYFPVLCMRSNLAM